MYKVQTHTGLPFPKLSRCHLYSEESDVMASPNPPPSEKARPAGGHTINHPENRLSLQHARRIIRDAWPALFPGGFFRPVKIGITKDMIHSEAAARLNLKPAEIKRMMWLVCQTFNYRKSVAQPDSVRWDLNGHQVEPVSDEHREEALREIRAVGKQRALKLKNVTDRYALFLTRPSSVRELAWVNESDEVDNICLVVHHSSKWATPARLSFDFSRQLLKFRPDEREALSERMWRAVKGVVHAAWLYHGVTIKLQAETPHSGLFSGLDELSVHTVIERLYRKFHNVFHLPDPYLLYKEAGIHSPTLAWRRNLVLEEIS